MHTNGPELGARERVKHKTSELITDKDKEPKTICIDFDQTLCDSVYPDVGPSKPGAREAMLAFKEMGFTIIISSCRSCGWNWDIYYGDDPVIHAKDRKVFQDMERWLAENDIPYDILDCGEKGKVSASYYIDDKGVRYNNNWDETVAEIQEYERNK